MMIFVTAPLEAEIPRVFRSKSEKLQNSIKIFDPKFGPADDKNAQKSPFKAVWSFQKVIGGVSIGIWEKSRNLGPPAL